MILAAQVMIFLALWIALTTALTELLQPSSN
jgi:hypothetical protein